jgi:prephenate dehydrogenase
MIKQLTIIGVGLIGGSLARALRAAGYVQEVVGVGRSLASLQQAVTLGVVDRIETSLSRAASDADMLVLASPVGAMPGVFAAIAPYLSAKTVITDVGSVKGSITEAARAHLGARFPRFVPGHPLAGRESSGVAASLADLFRGQRVILTPTAETDAAAVQAVDGMWRAAGAKVVSMPVAEHDAILAATSHLPHLLAYALVDQLAQAPAARRVFDYIGNGFRDMTRIAASDPVMWRDICLANRAALLQAISDYRGQLDRLAQAIEQADGAKLEAFFTRAQSQRTGLDQK